MAVPSAETQTLIDQAFSDKAFAAGADASHEDAIRVLATAIDEEAADKNAALQAHKIATASAHDALEALATELGYNLPS